MKVPAKNVPLIGTLIILVASFFLQNGALEFTGGDVFGNTFLLVVAGAGIGALAIQRWIKQPLIKGLAKSHLKIAFAIGLAALEMFPLTAAISKIGIGLEATIFSLGALFANARTDKGLRWLALGGVVLADGPWHVTHGSVSDYVVGLAMAGLAAFMNWTYQTCVFGTPFNPVERRRVVGAGLLFTSIFALPVGIVGHFALGAGKVPTSWSEVVIMAGVGIASLAIPGVVYSKVGEILPKEITGFVFQFSTVASAVVGEVFAVMGLVGGAQKMTLLSTAGVLVILAVTAQVMRNDMRRKRAEDLRRQLDESIRSPGE